MRLILMCILLSIGSPAFSCDPGTAYDTALDQAWPEADQEVWYSLSQGSRLIPLSWYQALPVADGPELFSDRDVQRRYFDLFCPDSGLPVGVVIDDDADKGPSVGLTCAACHTGVLDDGVRQLVVAGGSSTLDMQGYMSDLFAALSAVYQQGQPSSTAGPAWTRFADRVLGPGHSVSEARALHDEIAGWLSQRYKIQQSVDAARSWGHGRADAVAVIQNTAAALSDTRAGTVLPVSSAPVSYPHVWNAPQMRRVQWNGSATKLADIGLINTVETGAITRNVAEVLGVFAEIELGDASDSFLPAYPNIRSSVRLANLVRLERALDQLRSPAWPAIWGAIDPGSEQYQRGQALYAQNCSGCHSVIDRSDLDTVINDAGPGRQAQPPFTRMVPVFDIDDPEGPGHHTDPMAACNALTHTSWTGRFSQLHDSFSTFQKLYGDTPLSALQLAKFPEDAVTLDLVAELSIRMIVEKRGELMALQGQDIADSARGYFDGIVNGLFGDDPGDPVDPANIYRTPRQGSHDAASLVEARTICAALLRDLRAAGRSVELLAYKARPLNGIFATAPFLHNGSVPTLADLLLPPEQRPDRFQTGSVLFDPLRVGLGAARPGGRVHEFTVRDAAGQIIPGNSNLGHDRPASPTCRAEPDGAVCAGDRAALLLYLKSL